MALVQIITALASEAKPLIEFYQLDRAPSDGVLRWYRNDYVQLMVSGVGKANAAAAVRQLHHVSGARKNQAWMNIGIAGHSSLPLGSGVLAHKVMDRTSSKSWYPQIIFKPPVRTETVLTVDRIQKKYLQPFVYEMEASGFYDAASHFSTMELVHVYKIISDNRKVSSRLVTSAAVEGMVRCNLRQISMMVKELHKLAEDVERVNEQPADVQRFLNCWHFTVTQQHQLLKLLKRWQVLAGRKRFRLETMGGLRGAEDVLKALTSNINSMVPTFHD